MLLEKDEIRVPIQTSGAVLLAYGIETFFGLPQVTWAAFSALFVVQASIGGTIGTALFRVVGALIGAAIALVLIALLGVQGWRVFAALFIGVTSMSFITARWPSLSYGLVTVTIIIVTPDFYVVEGAIEKIVAILVGSCCGMIAAVAVLPISAHRSADTHLAAAVRDCGEFLVECMQCMTEGSSGKQRGIDQKITNSLDRARDMTRQADIEKKTPTMRRSLFPDTLLPEVERFRYTLTLIDRISDKPLCDEFSRDHASALRGLAEAAHSQLEKIAVAIDACAQCEEMTDVWNSYDAISDCVDRFRPSDRKDTEQLMAMKWAYHSVLSNMSDLNDRVNSRAKK